MRRGWFGTRLVASSSPASAICTVLSFSGICCAAVWEVYATEEAPQPLRSWGLFSLAFMSALKVAVIDTLMRDVDVDMDCPCSSSWQSFEVLLEVHCSEHFGPEVVMIFFASTRDGTVTFDALRNNNVFWKSE